jgi:hypothetical protein
LDFTPFGNTLTQLSGARALINLLRPAASAWLAFDKELRTLMRHCDLAA